MMWCSCGLFKLNQLCFALVKVNTSVQEGRKEGVSQSKGNEKGASSSGQEKEYGGLTRMSCEDDSIVSK